MSPTARVRHAEPPSLALILDADGVTKLAHRDRRVREMLRQEVTERGGRIVVPWVAVIQARADRRAMGAIDLALEAADALAGVDRRRTVLASDLLRETRTTDVPDALVAVEALLLAPSVVITSDPGDLRRLLDADPRGRRVEVWPI